MSAQLGEDQFAAGGVLYLGFGFGARIRVLREAYDTALLLVRRKSVAQ